VLSGLLDLVSVPFASYAEVSKGTGALQVGRRQTSAANTASIDRKLNSRKRI
jgi:hypothetical protein